MFQQVYPSKWSDFLKVFCGDIKNILLLLLTENSRKKWDKLDTKTSTFIYYLMPQGQVQPYKTAYND